jgi:hypothetical protein
LVYFVLLQDFEVFLDLIESGGKGSAAAFFVTARDAEPDDKMGFAAKRALKCELYRISATEKRVPEILHEAPEAAAQRLLV